MPREDGFDRTLSLMREGYLYILNRRRSFHSDVFETKLLGKRVICMGGKEAAEIFYDTDKFKRKGATPNRVVQTLFGKNGVQALDGQAHQHRKEKFMSIMSKGNLERLTDITKQQWEHAIEKWTAMDQVIFYEEVQKLLCRTACEWAGVTVSDRKIDELANDLEAMFESPTAVGPDHWKGRNARNRVERWVAEMIQDVRAGKIQPAENTALHAFAFHQDLDGNLLDAETAAVEVINILRPIVAIAIFVNFALLAVHHYPEEKKKLQSSDDQYAMMFVQEVRRY